LLNYFIITSEEVIVAGSFLHKNGQFILNQHFPALYILDHSWQIWRIVFMATSI